MNLDTAPSTSTTTMNSDYNWMRSPLSNSDFRPVSNTGFSVPTIGGSSCEILKRDMETLKKRLNLQARLLNEMRKKHKSALNKIRKICKEKVDFLTFF